MREHVFSDPAKFLAVAGDYLRENEAENSLVLGLADDLARRSPDADASTPWFLYVTEGEDPESSGLLAAWQTLPYIVGLTRTGREDVITTVAPIVAPRFAVAEYLMGPRPGVRLLVEKITATRQCTADLQMEQALHIVRRVTPVPEVAGKMQQATTDDLPIAFELLSAFVAATDQRQIDVTTVRHVIEAGEIFLWVDGTPRALAAWSGRSGNGVRINRVYTPPEYRRQGYATACVAALSQRLLDDGCAYCTLYTDLANPTANRIYSKIGYQRIGDNAIYKIS